MNNYYEWQDLVDTDGAYKIRLNKDNRTVEIIGPKGALLKRRQTKGYAIYGIRFSGKNKRNTGAHMLSYKQWCDSSYFPGGRAIVVHHKDSDPLNNHPENLSLITQRENNSIERTIKSGLPVGVTVRPDTKKYEAAIGVKYKRCYLGVYTNPEDASAAYQEALHRLNTLGHV